MSSMSAAWTKRRPNGARCVTAGRLSQRLAGPLRGTTAWLGILLVTSLLVVATVLDFARRMETTIAAGVSPLAGMPAAAVVFTGQFDRIHAGLGLLREGRVDRLFISGVNPGAGIRIESFADQFGLDGGLRAALVAGRIVLGPHAQNTGENAAETACWVAGLGLSGPILLVTAAAHMPRASAALERALPDRRVERLSVPGHGGPGSWRTLAKEFLKFAVTRLAAIVPGNAIHLRRQDISSKCQARYLRHYASEILQNPTDLESERQGGPFHVGAQRGEPRRARS